MERLVRRELRQVGPERLAGYLTARGWFTAGSIGERGAIWRHPNLPDAVFVQPLSVRLGDYVARVAEVVRAIAETENRTEGDVLRDLTARLEDRIEFRLEGQNVGDGTVSLEEGAKAFEYVREAVVAAACATVATRPVFRGRRAAAALRYLEGSRLGSVRAGSFTIVVHSPLPSAESQIATGDSFERRAVLTLLGASEAALRAASQVGSGAKEAFEPSVADGVSANLCESVAGLADVVGSGTVTIGSVLSEAWMRPAVDRMTRSVTFSTDLVPRLRAGALALRTMVHEEGYELRGMVVSLDRKAEGDGTVAVRGTTPKGERLVLVELDGSRYERAIEAHRLGLRVIVTGLLHRPYGRWQLVDVTQFSLEER